MSNAWEFEIPVRQGLEERLRNALVYHEAGKITKRRLDQAGMIELTSGSALYWLRGHLWVGDHPYAAFTDAEGALRLIRQLRERGCILVSVTETWLTASPEVQDVLVAFAGWMAKMESDKRSERIRAGLARRKAADLPIGRKPGARDKGKGKRSPYVAAWEPGGARREAHQAASGMAA